MRGPRVYSGTGRQAAVLSFGSLFGCRPRRKPEVVQREEATARLAFFIATGPLGAISFNELSALAQRDASLVVFTDVVIDFCRRRVLDQFVRVDGDPAFDYPDFTAIPHEVNGRPAILERLQLYYRVIPPKEGMP